jgi:hypothetical protein
MDENIPDLSTGTSLPKEDDVYRIVLVTQRDRKNKSIPAVSCFSLSPQDQNKLSVDWSKMTTPEVSIARFGAMYKFHSTDFKPYDNREIYALNIDFLHSFTVIEDVVHDPICINPPELGSVSNPAHSLIVFSAAFKSDQAMQPEVLLKIRDHAKDRKVEIDWEKTEQLVKKLRKEE